MNGARLFAVFLLLAACANAYDMALVRTWNGVPDISMAVKLEEGLRIPFTEYVGDRADDGLTPRMVFNGPGVPGDVLCAWEDNEWFCGLMNFGLLRLNVIDMAFNDTAVTEIAGKRVVVKVPDGYIIPQTAVLTFNHTTLVRDIDRISSYIRPVVAYVLLLSILFTGTLSLFLFCLEHIYSKPPSRTHRKKHHRHSRK